MARQYTKEFKQEAVALCEQDDLTVVQVFRDLDVAEGVLYWWRQLARREGADAFRGKGQRTPEQARLAELERQVKLLEMERDILKEALGIFAKGRR